MILCFTLMISLYEENMLCAMRFMLFCCKNYKQRKETFHST